MPSGENNHCFEHYLNFGGTPLPKKIAWLSLNWILERSWVALYSVVCVSVRHRCHPTKCPLFPIYTGIQALCWPNTIYKGIRALFWVTQSILGLVSSLIFVTQFFLTRKLVHTLSKEWLLGFFRSLFCFVQDMCFANAQCPLYNLYDWSQTIEWLKVNYRICMHIALSPSWLCKVLARLKVSLKLSGD